MFQNAGGNDFGGGFAGGFGGGTAFASPAGGGDRQRKFKFNNIIPILASQLKEVVSEDSGFKLGKTDISQVTLVGTVVQVERSQTCNTYKIDDTTGIVTVKHWNAFAEDDEEPEHETVFEEGTPVRVFGQIRSFQKNINLNGLNIGKVDDLNEITVHMLTCMHFKLRSTAKTGMAHGKGGLPQTNQNASHQSNNPMDLGMDSVQTQVWKLIQSSMEPDGISITSIRSNLRGLNVNQIKKAVDFLCNEGHIYSTIDDDHFKTTSF
uniref:Replication protein A C-terminal domain-containing protein n=1 Tax=Ciona savignyi TaxID=51511 RepID=H2ZJT3_CIOSA